MSLISLYLWLWMHFTDFCYSLFSNYYLFCLCFFPALLPTTRCVQVCFITFLSLLAWKGFLFCSLVEQWHNHFSSLCYQEKYREKIPLFIEHPVMGTMLVIHHAMSFDQPKSPVNSIWIFPFYRQDYWGSENWVTCSGPTANDPQIWD